MDFNDAQLEAIETLDNNVLVSAGAGSGKTGVLVERFCRLVRDGLARPDEILTVTFTEKAAKEMKDRIIARFNNWAAETGDNRFAAAARAVEFAYIGTIHSFATRVLKENAFEAGVDPRFKVLTETEADALREQVLEKTIVAGFAGGRPEYIELLLAYGRRDADRAVKDLHAQLASLARDEAAPAPVGPADMAAAAEAYYEAAAAILDYEGEATAKLADCLDDFNRLYPDVREAMAAAVTDLDKLGAAEFTRRFDWDRYELIARAAKIIPGNCGSRDFRTGWRTPAAEALEVFLETLIAPLSFHYSECLVTVTVDFAREYEAVKRRTGRLDFNDLLLAVRRLLIGPEGGPTATAAEYRQKFKYVMIDEFQDTNALQKSIVESVCGARRLFTVGDVKQSIYSFMHSDVSVFLTHQRATAAGDGEIVPMEENYRSRPEVIEFVNGFFSELWREDADFEFEGLRAAGDFYPEPPRDVELLWVEKSTRDNEVAGAEGERAAEARAIAARIRALLGLDGGSPARVTKKGPGLDGPRALHAGDILILFRSTGNIKVYERALAEAGLDYYVVSGRGFYAALEVKDMLNLLRAVENPLNDVALAAVMRSPMVAVNEDTLWWLTRTGDGNRAGKLYEALGRADEIDAIEPEERARLVRFRDTLRALYAVRSESRLTRLIDLAVERTAYDLKLLASEQGKRRYANLRKLADAAREFGTASVFQLPDFIRHLERMAVVAQREGEAPTESEESRVIRLMTVHGAKGLQAPVVFVADLGRQMKVGPGDKTFVFDKELGVAAKVRGPAGDPLSPRQFALAARRAKARDIAEEKRLFYVAATRAEELLVLSGAAGFDGQAQKKDSYNDLQSWMAWLERGLGSWRLRCIEGSAGPLPGGSGQALAVAHREELLAGKTLPVAAGPTIDVSAVTAPPPAGAKRPIDLTVTAVLNYLACPRRYELRSLMGLEESAAQRKEPPDGAGAPALSETPTAAAPATDPGGLGSIVHEIMASIDWAGDATAQVAEATGRLEPPLREEVRRRFARFLDSPWPARIKAGTDRFQEVPFRSELKKCRLRGRIDLLFREPGGWVVVDYKTGAGADKESYAEQVRLYALAVAKALGEAPAEIALAQLSAGADFTQKIDSALLAETEALLEQTAERIRNEEFPGKQGDRCYRCGYYRRFCQPA